MTGNGFDEMAQRLASNRRTALTAGAALALGGMLATRAPQPASARKRKRKRAYTCPLPEETSQGIVADARAAQSFTALRGGTLRQIAIAISHAEAAGDYVVQLLTMAGNTPSHSPLDVLAAATVPKTQVKTGDVKLVANFTTTKLSPGITYAVAVSGPDSGIVLRLKAGGTDCPGALFVASGASAFGPIPGGARDMIVTVLVG